MSQNNYLLSEADTDRIRDLSESFHFAVLEFIESRKVKTNEDEQDDNNDGEAEYEAFKTIHDELELMKQEKFDF